LNWLQQRTRIRRMLRDPNGAIWADSLLKALFNEMQMALQQQTIFNEDVALVRVPSMYEASYLYDWEWAFTDHAKGYVWNPGAYYDPMEMVALHSWEPEHLALSYADNEDATGSAFGVSVIHPFEGYMGETPAELPSSWFPFRFDHIVFSAWDKDPLEPYLRREMSADDPSHHVRWGNPQGYYRDEKLENHLILYPGPSAPEWTDINGIADIEYYGMVLFTEDDTASSEYGVCIDIDDGIIGTSEDVGLCIDILAPGNTLLMVHRVMPKNIDGADDDRSVYPAFMQKYLEYGVLERCYAAETDGQIESLRQYWSYRKEMGLKVLGIYKNKRRIDRDYLLRSHSVPARNVRRGPRLPDHYPAI
jgi:hypothetical protein